MGENRLFEKNWVHIISDLRPTLMLANIIGKLVKSRRSRGRKILAIGSNYEELRVSLNATNENHLWPIKTILMEKAV